MPTWPTDLPQKVAPEQYREQPPMAAIEQPMDAGAPKSFRAGTDDGRVFTVKIDVTGVQRDSFDAFYRGDLRDGSLDFDWVLPREQTAVKFRFLAEPTYRQVVGDIYEVAMLLETREPNRLFGFRSKSLSRARAKVATGATFGFRSSTGSIVDIS